MRILRDPQVILTVLCGLALVLSFFRIHPSIPYLSVASGSYFALRTAWESLRERSIDVNLLMVLAAVGAVVVGQPIDAAALLFLFSLSSSLESLAMARTKSAIESLVKLRPDKAILIRDGAESQVRVEDLKLDDVIKIPPFEAVPVDGVVQEGQSSVDQSAMTGESIPVAKQMGDRLLAGTRNLDSALIVKVASTVGDSTLDKIVALVQDAQENKASGERISTWLGKRYTFFVIAAFAVALGARLAIGEPMQAALYASLTLLVALSPCALVISTPATTLSALGWAARNGMLVRGGEFIEKAGRIDTIALDKTGTLTAGKPKLVEICVCAKSLATVGGPASCEGSEACWHGEGNLTPDTRELLRYAASAERYASHPVAEAIRQAARDHGIEAPQADEEFTSPGLGVGARVEGKQVLVGQPGYLRSEGIDIPAEFERHVAKFNDQGMTVALIAVEDQIAAMGFMDIPRPEAEGFVREVRRAGATEIIVLSGDTERTVEVVAGKLGIGRFHGSMLPDEKARAVQELSREGRHVLMIGDGVNDAPPLASAAVGVAMGGLGSDIALNAADVVLMHDRLDRVPQLMWLGKKTNRIIRANLLFAGGVIVALTIWSLFGTLPLPLAVVGHEGSTVLVILNGLRVLRGP